MGSQRRRGAASEQSGVPAGGRLSRRKNELTYRIVEYDPPRAVTFIGENATVISRDRITFETTTDGTRVTYDADLALKGPLRIADPLLGLAFNRVGDRALDGLRQTLALARPQP